MVYHGINFSQANLEAFCLKYGVKRLSLFGSILRRDFGPESDIDVLIEFTSGRTPSLLTLGEMQDALCRMLHRQVDLKTLDFMSDYVRDRVLSEAQVQYAA